MQLTSIAFADQQAIPRRYTCDADNHSPPLEWADLPDGTQSLALIMDDPDAPDPRAPQRTFVHWVLYNIPPDAVQLAEAAEQQGLPFGTRQGSNDGNGRSYGGPCPPVGRHRYFHKLYALNTVLPDLHFPDKGSLEQAMEGHVLAYAELVGTYERGH